MQSDLDFEMLTERQRVNCSKNCGDPNQVRSRIFKRCFSMGEMSSRANESQRLGTPRKELPYFWGYEGAWLRNIKKEQSIKSDVLFSSYLANMNMPNGSSNSVHKVLAKPSRPSLYDLKDNTDDTLPDNMKVDVLLKRIGAESSWPNHQMKSDMEVLFKNRIYTVKDLRTLSKESWKKIDLLPIVKDLLRENINHGRNNLDDDSGKKRTEKLREKMLSKEIFGSKDMENVNTIVAKIQPTVEKQIDEVVPRHTQNEKTKSHIQSIRTSFELPKRFMPPPNKIAMGDRMKVKTSNGKIYEVDRLCPHAKADLSARVSQRRAVIETV
ncbi:4762_t:CDS:2 [Acaulospora morrowiae]|uniref:4762_t:CDS:1 n=1 Tax=Acaulospora morrowiae TaxID=94023 RepID=A0A9N8WBP0_9GLOM|nr:4762_t:CDS:2 [Acaulospora morrowiae]